VLEAASVGPGGSRLTGRLTITDSELVARVLAGAEDAFRTLVLRYQRPVYGLIVRMVRERELAEDLSQEGFLMAYRALDSYGPRRKFSSWLIKIAHNATIDHLRRGELQTVPLEAETDDDRGLVRVLEDPTTVTPERRLLGSDLGQALAEAVHALRPAYREVILLRHREDLSYQEIAEVTGSSLGTVKTNLHRARRELAELLRARGLLRPGEGPEPGGGGGREA
jgi:RNA polymerase sigma-70 factor (ECF subfamily)